MPPKKSIDPPKFDYRVYLGLIIFHWKLIVVCFLWALLLGVIYIRVTDEAYSTTGQIRIVRDDLKSLPSPKGAVSWGWHKHVISGRCRDVAAARVGPDWVDVIGPENLKPAVKPSYIMGLGGVIRFEVTSAYPEYAKVFLQAVMEEHRNAWEDDKRGTLRLVTSMLGDELTRLGEFISQAEDDVIEFQRVHRLPVIEAQAKLEEGFLSSILARKNQLKMEQFLHETQHPFLKDLNAGTLRHISDLTQQSGLMTPGELDESVRDGLRNFAKEAGDVASVGKESRTGDPLLTEPGGYSSLKVALYLAQAQEERLTARFEAGHPELKSIRENITNIERELEVQRKVQLESILDRNRAIAFQLSALEDAEYTWEGRYYATSRQKAEFRRVRANLGRYEGAYSTIYSRIFDVKVSEEMKAERYTIMSSAASSSRPSWPNPRKVLSVALAIGLGTGFGLAFVVYFLDNKVQTIRDIEVELGLPFLGGVPYWVHSDLERTVRPIVTEEFSAGAVEAYRALRTSVLTAVDKAGEKTIIMTSADSKEGKTLTSLNLAIMIAQAGRKVLLMDMDLRRGRLHRSLECERSPGITEALHEHWPLVDVIVPTRYENLSFAPSGENKEQVAENLHGADLKKFFAAAERDYDYIVVDTAPVLRVTDTVILASQQLGVVVYVAHVNRTPKPLIKYSLDLLTNARVLGVIMNSIEMHTISGIYYSYQYPNYAYYSNAYAYGYTYGYYHDDGAPDSKRKWSRHRRPPSANGHRGVKAWVRKYLLPTK
ncbi:MAG: polysaccharide biosynthesis tyrosine autokinase [Verrucomicrobia bacterium]|nr:polysaccharide biosynthesis tyrosine autokinase [Verrucomicrobiota bacterium]